MKDATVTYSPVENAVEILGCFLIRYWQGLTMPLRFFPATSLEFAATGGNLEKARKKFVSSYKYTGEEEDPCFRLCFGQEDDPLAADFGSIALELLTPMLACRSKEQV
jgi:exodeoxyribonuclease V gamma subunit